MEWADLGCSDVSLCHLVEYDGGSRDGNIVGVFRILLGFIGWAVMTGKRHPKHPNGSGHKPAHSGITKHQAKAEHAFTKKGRKRMTKAWRKYAASKNIPGHAPWKGAKMRPGKPNQMANIVGGTVAR